MNATYNFFDAIGVADMEKVHSAVIGWMLSDKCDAFGTGDEGREIRSELLRRLFGIQSDFQKFKTIESHLEWRNIDILIVTESLNGEKKCWVIENKIKSSQHSDQLNRYVKIMNCPKLMSSKQYDDYFSRRLSEEEVKKLTDNPYKECEKAYCFLTLIDEKQITVEEVEWKSARYSALAETLKNAKKNEKGKDYPFVVEYQKCIEKMSEAVDKFLKGHTTCLNVFTDGCLKREDKPTYSEGIARYISENGLETIFQKCFLSTIIHNPKTKFGKHDFIKISVSETHGTALADFTYKIVGDTTYGFQFQNGTFKIQIAAEEDPSSFFERWLKVFTLTDGEKKVDTGEYGSWTLNKSKEGKKSYLSISRPKKRQSKKNPVPFWYEKDLDKIIKEWNTAFDECIYIMDNKILINP